MSPSGQVIRREPAHESRSSHLADVARQTHVINQQPNRSPLWTLA
jgi:hypothetical protein